MHGGAHGSGAPKGNINALKHGYYSTRAIEERRRIRELLGVGENLLEKMEAVDVDPEEWIDAVYSGTSGTGAS